MFKIKAIALSFLSVFSLLSLTTPILAGGWPVSTWTWDNPEFWKDGSKLTYVRAHIAPDVPCVGTTVTFKYENPQPGDSVNAGGENATFTFTEEGKKYSKYNGTMIPDCNTYAKFYSTNNTEKIGIVEFKPQSGPVYSRKFALNFHLSSPGNTDSNEKYPLPWEEDYIKRNSTPAPVPTAAPSNIPMPGAPEMVYPVDRQILDLEGAYMFKVKEVQGASGYLFGLFQDGQMIYENYRDTRTLSSNGEFALWENNPFHSKFHEGDVQIWVRAYVRDQWTDARIITINLKPRGGARIIQQTAIQQPITQQTPTSRVSTPTPPAIQPSQQIVTVTDSSASAALQNQINEMQQKLEASEQRQSSLETQLNQIISWIKSIFPFFK